MTQTLGTGGGAATRQFQGNLYRILQKSDLEHGVLLVADYQKLDIELTNIYQGIQHADPTITGSNRDGNFTGSMIQVTTPATTGTMLTINHKLGRIPVGWISIGPMINGAGTVSWRQVQSADVNNIYLKVVDTTDTNIVTSLVVW